MRNKNSYSRIIQATDTWEKHHRKGEMINLLHECVELDITTFSLTDFTGTKASEYLFGTALSESGLSRDQIQLMAQITQPTKLIDRVDELLLKNQTDYLDLLLLDVSLPRKELLPELDVLFSREKILEIGSINLKDPERDLLSQKIPLMVNLFNWPYPSTGTERELTLTNLTSVEFTNMAWCSWRRDYEENLLKDNVFKSLCEKYNSEPQQLLLAYLLQHSAYLYPVIEESDKHRIETAAASKNINFEKEDQWTLTKIIKSSDPAKKME